ncbi:MAG: polysaccharide deacetylase family protein [Negativicutes bacterium]
MGSGRKRHAWKRWLGVFFAICLLAAGGLAASIAIFPPEGVLILEYHKVNDWSDDSYTVPTADFAAQLDELSARGYTTISLLDFLRAKKGKQKLPDKPVILTFDDGYLDNYTDMLPLLEARGMKATVFMVTNDIGLPGYLTWDALRDMQERGIEIGSHTANHLPLTGMPPSEAEKEVKLSKLLLEWNGIRTVFGFSYPNGSYAEYISAILKRNEYLAAVTGDPGLNTMDTDPYLLQRINIPRPRLGLTEFRLRLFKADLCDRLGLWRHRIK